MIDDDAESWWSTGPGDLALNPVDVDLIFKQPQVVDTLVVVTSTLKGQLRLKDFDVFAGSGGRWDGSRPLARVRENAEKVVTVRFPAVRVDRLRLRILGTHRNDHAFAHIADLAVHTAMGKPQRKVEPSPFPRSLANAGHDPEALRSLIDEHSKTASSGVVRKRLRVLEGRLRLIQESQKYEDILQRIAAETERYRQLGAPQWALAQRDCMARLRNWAYSWIDHQQPNGQFGGGYEDDVELVCGWPVLVMAQDAWPRTTSESAGPSSCWPTASGTAGPSWRSSATTA